MSPLEDPRFVYPKVPDSPVTSAQLNDLWKVITTAGTGTFASIVAGVKIILLACLFFALRSIVALERQRAKQQYEQDQAKKNQDEVDQPEPGAP
jgi:MFS superfamily sulfate permease-like transporter